METLKDQVNRLESGDAASVNGPMDKQIAEAVTEYKEREKRKCNLIFHNVKESAKTDSLARRKEDIEEVIQIGKEMGCEPEVKKAIRLGKRVDGRTRLRKKFWWRNSRILILIVYSPITIQEFFLQNESHRFLN